MNAIDPAVLDLAQLRQFTAGDPALEWEIADLFAETSRGYLDMLQPDAADTPWREAAHSLKGSARSLGAGRVAAAAAAAERLTGEAGGREVRMTAAAELRAAVAEVIAAFQSLTAGAAG